MSSKINWLVSHVPVGALVLPKYLVENGIGYTHVQQYVESGWLKKLSSGVYYRPDSDDSQQPGWVEALGALMYQLHLPVHLAGLTSLRHQGMSHYLPFGKEHVWIGVKNKRALPKWFREFEGQSWFFSSTRKLAREDENDFITVAVKGLKLKASCPELAAYETVDAIGKQISFEHVAELFQGLISLSPRRVQSILDRSSAVQTNRVFLFLSHYCDHQWVKRLDESRINLGTGKRQVVAQGRLDERYQITVPESFC